MEIQEIIVIVLNGIQCYPQVMPSDGSTILPCVVYQRISTKQYRHMEGNGSEQPRYQLSVWADDYQKCVETATETKSRLDLNQTNFKISYKDNESEPQIPDESGLYRIILDFIILN